MQSHDERFENLNLDTVVASKNRRTKSYVSLEKCLQRSEKSPEKFSKCLIDYDVNESQTKKNLKSFVALEK